MKSVDVESYLEQIPSGNGFEPFFREHGLKYRWIAMGSVVLGNLVAMLAVTMINVAIPAVMGAYGVGQDQAQWLATGNLAASTMAMLVCGWFCDRFGLRRLMLTALGLFLGGSLLGGVATSFELMIVARVMQGITAGLLMPMSMTIIFQLFPPGQQGLSMGLSAFGIILAPALGPTIGGVLVDALNWRYVFFLGVPISMLGMPLALSYLPGKLPKKERPFDFIGFTLLTIGLMALLIAITNSQRYGWDSNYVVSASGIAIVMIAWFIYSQLHTPSPLINIDLFRIPKFTVMSIFAFAFTAGMFGSTYLLPLMFQLVQHKTPTDAGLLLMPAGLAMAVMFPITGKLSDTVPHTLLIGLGISLFALSFWLLGSADEYTGYWMLVGWVILTRLAIGLVNTPIQISALADVERHRLAEASGVFNFMRQVGGAFGVNGIAQVLEYRRNYHTDYLISTQTWDNSYTIEALYLFRGLSHRFGIEGVDQWRFAYQALSETLQMQSLVAAFKDAFLILALAFALLLIPLWRIRKIARSPLPHLASSAR